MNRILVLAPNWLGDAVMAVPCIDAIRRQPTVARLVVAARAHLAPLYEMVPGVDEAVRLERPGRLGGWLAALRDARRLREAAFDIAILLPNSFRAAWIARRAGIAERWGYATDGRTKMLTRAAPPVHGCHQAEYYLRLLERLGMSIGRPDARTLPSVSLNIAAADRDFARRALTASGWKVGEPLVGMAPGAAYGGAKQWPAARFGQLVRELAGTASASGVSAPKRTPGARTPPGVRTVLVGSLGDRPACDEIVKASARESAPINLCGATDLRQLAAVIAECRAFVSNDSGAMHLAAAVGVPVVAIFGSTNEAETAPLPVGAGRGEQGAGSRDQGSGGEQGSGSRDRGSGIREHAGIRDHAIIVADVDCRPCMLRECPLENHPCMTGIDVSRVNTEVLKRIGDVLR